MLEKFMCIDVQRIQKKFKHLVVHALKSTTNSCARNEKSPRQFKHWIVKVLSITFIV